MENALTPEERELLTRISKKTGSKGGQTTVSRYGTSHFSEIGKKAAAVRWGKHKKKTK